MAFAANRTQLANGQMMPTVGFGCAGQLSRGPIGNALLAGYRLFDTSQATEWYLEAELGEAVDEVGADDEVGGWQLAFSPGGFPIQLHDLDIQ